MATGETTQGVDRPPSGWLAWVAGLALALLALLPLRQVLALDWLEYLRVWLATVGLAYLWWRRFPRGGASRGEAVVLGLAYVYLLNQFAAAGWLALFLAAVAFVTAWWAGSQRRAWGWPDWVALAIWFYSASVSAGLALLASQAVPWPAQARITALLLVWLAATRAAPIRSPYPAGGRLSLSLVVLAVLAAASAVGAVRVTAVLWQSWQGEGARRQGDLPRAAASFTRALEGSTGLEMTGVSTRVAFDLASVLVAQGQPQQAAAVLGLAPGFIDVVPGDAWDGPEGGNLYYSISCWKDLVLLPGKVEIRVFASGTQALDVWPQMRVELGERVLGDVFVTGDVAPYAFALQVPARGRQRLRISFLNDFHQLNPYHDRNLLVGQVEVEYRRIAWE